MNDSKNIYASPNANAERSHRGRPLIAVGAVLWVLCFAGLGMIYVNYRAQATRSLADAKLTAQDNDDGRSGKQLKLVPEQDGSFNLQMVGGSADETAWDADGIADFSFTDCQGQTVTKADLLGKPFVIGFVFTNCRGPCPTVTLEMRELQSRLKDYDFNLITLTVDPERDTPEVLLEYAKSQGADFDRWKFLTGPQFDIYRLIQFSFKMPVREITGDERVPGFEIIHSVNLLLVDSTGRVCGKFDARSGEDMARLRKEVKRLAKPRSNSDAAAGEVEKQ